MLFVMVGQELSLLLLPDATGILYDGRTAPLAACDRIVGNLVRSTHLHQPAWDRFVEIDGV